MPNKKNIHEILVSLNYEAQQVFEKLVQLKLFLWRLNDLWPSHKESMNIEKAYCMSTQKEVFKSKREFTPLVSYTSTKMLAILHTVKVW